MTYQELANKAEAATTRKSWAEAIGLWEEIRNEYPNKSQAYTRAAFALRQSGDENGAEALAQKAIELFPKDPGGYFQYAEVAMWRKDWPEAAKRWEQVRIKFPEHPGGYVRGGVALRLKYDLSHAEEMLFTATKLFLGDHNVFREYSEVAMRRFDWQEAIKRWDIFRFKFPDKPVGYIRGSVALRQNNELTRAAVLMQNTKALFPDVPEVFQEFSEISMHRKDWQEAVNRWAWVRNKFPDFLPGYIRGVIALRENNKYEQAESLLLEATDRIPSHPWAKFENINVQITLRCNMHCQNCIKLCNMKNATGLDYSDTDMTVGQIKRFIENVKQIRHKKLKVFESISITGGEPLLHPKVVEITKTIENELVKTGFAGKVYINSNLTIDPHQDIKHYIVNFSKPEVNPYIHNTVLLHPHDFSKPSPSFKTCNHYRKWRVVLNCHGYSLCCAGDAYIRLFCLPDLLLDHLPGCYSGFPLEKMDMVCQYCPFGTDSPPLQKDLGRPVSKCYVEQATLNKKGRKLNKILAI